MSRIICAILFVYMFYGCSGTRYIVPASMVRPDSLFQITDADIHRAFENRPQLIKPINIAIYNTGAIRIPLADSLRRIEGINIVYEISPILLEQENYFNYRYRGWSPYAFSPTLNVKNLRLLAAQGQADLLIIFNSSHFFRQRPNRLAWFYSLLFTLFFVPGVQVQLSTDVDLFFIDVRNGYLYATYHDNHTERDGHETLFYEMRNDERIAAYIQVMFPGILTAVRDILSTPRFYITEVNSGR